ncbi:MAG: tRNA 2-thiouridine(34) synthase MnmA [Patescibacteria group bacterium]
MSNLKFNKVFVMLSGGVDSSVAALLLKKDGHEVIGCHIKCYNVDGCGAKDADDARRVAEKLEIPFYVFDLEQEYKDKVVKYMVAGYKKGITPNPDVMCNSEIKFGLFLEKALVLGADFVATGHYVKLYRHPERSPKGEVEGSQCVQVDEISPARNALHSEAGGRQARDGYKSTSETARFCDQYLSLQIAKDKNKDQSYFLWKLTQDQLKHCLFPIGDYTKAEVRKIAKKHGLLTAEKKDSQGICFLGKVGLVDFLKQYIPEKKGAILDIAHNKVGEHNGAWFYTIGQRHLRIKNYELRITGTNRKPFYVVAKDIKKNTITIAEGDNHPALYKSEIKLTEVNLFSSVILKTESEGSNKDSSPMAQNDDVFEISVLARIRYCQLLQKATLQFATRRVVNCIIKFDKPQKAIAIGQSAVFYDTKGKEMLGGGIMENTK